MQTLARTTHALSALSAKHPTPQQRQIIRCAVVDAMQSWTGLSLLWLYHLLKCAPEKRQRFLLLSCDGGASPDENFKTAIAFAQGEIK
jgi:hypothetical protein